MNENYHRPKENHNHKLVKDLYYINTEKTHIKEIHKSQPTEIRMKFQQTYQYNSV